MDAECGLGYCESARSLVGALATARATDEQATGDVIDLGRIRRRDLLGGLIHEYQLAA